MDMDGKAIELIQTSAKAEHSEVTIKDLLFSTKKLEPIYHDPRPAALDVKSLTALVDYIKSDIDGLDKKKVMFHVESPETVALVSLADGMALRRSTWMRAKVDGNSFKFNQSYDLENFNIALQALFVDSDDRAEVLRISGNIKTEASETSTDDGVKQTVEMRNGIALGASETIPNPVTLQPWRTFREVVQPASLFVLRVHAGPKLALYEADGSAWKLEAMQSIKAWLAKELPDIAIIA